MGFHFTHQLDAMQCGVACMHMACRHFGKDIPMHVLEKMCPPTSDGISVLGIVKTLQALGFDTQCGKTDVDGLFCLPKPCILHWENRHFVILYKTRKKGNVKYFYIADPAKGLVRYDEDILKEKWATLSMQLKGVAITLNPKKAFFTDKKLKKEDNLSFGFFLRYIKQYKKHFLKVFLTLFVGCLIQLLFPLLTQSLVDKGINSRDISFVWLILIGQLMLSVCSTGLDFLRRRILLHVGFSLNMSIVTDFIEKLFRLPMSFFSARHTGDILQRMNDYGRIQSFLTGQLLSISFAVLTFVAFSIILLHYSVLMFVIYYFFTALYILWSFVFIKKRKSLDYDVFEKSAENQDNVWQLITNVQEIKLQGCAMRRREEWKDIQEKLFTLQLKSLNLQQAEIAGSVLINNSKNITITVLAALAVINGDISFGMMLAIQYVIGQMSSPVEQLIELVYSLQDVKISMERINAICNTEDENDGVKELIREEDNNNDIMVNNVTYRYDRFSPLPTLDNISINIRQGKVTAIVGASGSGKTTIMKLILGYSKGYTGDIKIGNEDLRNLDLDSWRKRCGVVMQDGVLFADTITGNITMSDTDYDEERLKEACRIAQIEDYIETLPLKYDTKIGHNGMGMSAGQKQRILIARAIYRNPQYLFMDESTNALDANTEMKIIDTLGHFYKGRTVLLIAHRLSTVRNADEIIVMDKGRVIEMGKHETLLMKHGEYYRLVENQIGV